VERGDRRGGFVEANSAPSMIAQDTPSSASQLHVLRERDGGDVGAISHHEGSDCP
jgi:hypothetical protein